MKSFQFDWQHGIMKGIYQIPLQEEMEIEAQAPREHTILTYSKIITVINAPNKKEAIKKFAKRYKVKFKNA